MARLAARSGRAWRGWWRGAGGRGPAGGGRATAPAAAKVAFTALNAANGPFAARLGRATKVPFETLNARNGTFMTCGRGPGTAPRLVLPHPAGPTPCHEGALRDAQRPERHLPDTSRLP
ncbi:hypothetical protein GCM10010174_70600 [Kutzneria viridogrisea]